MIFAHTIPLVASEVPPLAREAESASTTAPAGPPTPSMAEHRPPAGPGAGAAPPWAAPPWLRRPTEPLGTQGPLRLQGEGRADRWGPLCGTRQTAGRCAGVRLRALLSTAGEELPPPAQPATAGTRGAPDPRARDPLPSRIPGQREAVSKSVAAPPFSRRPSSSPSLSVSNDPLRASLSLSPVGQMKFTARFTPCLELAVFG
jgi:hypothetical protein